MKNKQRFSGEGSFYFDKAKNRWYDVLTLGYKDDKPIRKKVSDKTFKGAQKKFNELKEHVLRGQLTEKDINFNFNRITVRRTITKDINDRACLGKVTKLVTSTKMTGYQLIPGHFYIIKARHLNLRTSFQTSNSAGANIELQRG